MCQFFDRGGGIRRLDKKDTVFESRRFCQSAHAEMGQRFGAKKGSARINGAARNTALRETRRCEKHGAARNTALRESPDHAVLLETMSRLGAYPETP